MKKYIMHGMEEAQLHRNCAIYNNPMKQEACLLHGKAVTEHQTELFEKLTHKCKPEMR
jgi:hypothetical protein